MGRVEDLHHVVFECPIYSSIRHQFPDLFLAFGGVGAAENQPYNASHMRCFMAQDQTRLAWFVYRCDVLRSRVEAEPGTTRLQRPLDRGVVMDDLDTFTSSDSEDVDDWFPPTEGLVDVI